MFRTFVTSLDKQGHNGHRYMEIFNIQKKTREEMDYQLVTKRLLDLVQ